jgi:hypothetical protein
VVVDEVVVIDSRGSIADWQMNLSLKMKVLGQSMRCERAPANARCRDVRFF